jgi:hypothetical protein
MYGDYVPKRYTIPPLRAPGNSPGGDESGNLSLSWDFGEQGKVVIQTRGDQLLILEGFDETVTQRAQKALF